MVEVEVEEVVLLEVEVELVEVELVDVLLVVLEVLLVPIKSILANGKMIRLEGATCKWSAVVLVLPFTCFSEQVVGASSSEQVIPASSWQVPSYTTTAPPVTTSTLTSTQHPDQHLDQHPEQHLIAPPL